MKNIKRWLNTPNEEGVTGQDAVLVPLTMISMMILLMNLGFWLMKPEQSWIGELIFFAK